jgi:hypothetical protein
MTKIRIHGWAGSRDFYELGNPAFGGIFHIHGFTGLSNSSNQTLVIHMDDPILSIQIQPTKHILRAPLAQRNFVDFYRNTVYEGYFPSLAFGW